MSNWFTKYWPMGRGLVVCATAIEQDSSGSIWLAACADGTTQADTDTPTAAWDYFLKNGGPHMVLNFPTADSIDPYIGYLRELQEEMRAANED